MGLRHRTPDRRPSPAGYPLADLYEASAHDARQDLDISILKRRKHHTRTLLVWIDGGGAVIDTGIAGDATLHFDTNTPDWRIASWRLLADQTGSIVVDIWKAAYADFPPTNANSITAAAPPTLSGAAKAQDALLTGWDVPVAPGDTFRFNVDSVATVTRVLLSLELIHRL